MRGQQTREDSGDQDLMSESKVRKKELDGMIAIYSARYQRTMSSISFNSFMVPYRL